MFPVLIQNGLYNNLDYNSAESSHFDWRCNIISNDVNNVFAAFSPSNFSFNWYLSGIYQSFAIVGLKKCSESTIKVVVKVAKILTSLSYETGPAVKKNF